MEADSKTDLSWQEFYKEILSTKKFIKRILCNLELLYLIIKKRPMSIVEIGTGTAALSAFLSWFLPKVIAIDNNKKVLIKAKLNCIKYGRKVNFVVADAFSLPFKSNSVTISFSQGFFEHFKNEEVNNLIKEQLRVCKKFIIFNVPSNFYPTKPFGNERLLSPKQWAKIITSTAENRCSFIAKLRYCKIDIEAFKYFICKARWKGFFEIIGIIKKCV